MGLDRLGAPERDLQGVDRLARPPGPQMNAPEEEVRAGVVRGEEQDAIQLGDRVGVVILLVKPPRAIVVVASELLLVSLTAVREGLLDLTGMREFDVALHPLEPARNLVARGPFVPLVIGGRQAAGQLLFPRRFGGLPGSRECGTEHVVCVAVGRVATHGFAQPVDSRLGVAFEPVQRTRG